MQDFEKCTNRNNDFFFINEGNNLNSQEDDFKHSTVYEALKFSKRIQSTFSKENSSKMSRKSLDFILGNKTR